MTRLSRIIQSVVPAQTAISANPNVAILPTEQESMGFDATPAIPASKHATQRNPGAKLPLITANAKPAKTIGKASTVAQTKSATVLAMLRKRNGATLEQLMEATGWQAHSVRGFLSGHIGKKLGLTIASEAGKDGVRRYRIDS